MAHTRATGVSSRFCAGATLDLVVASAGAKPDMETLVAEDPHAVGAQRAHARQRPAVRGSRAHVLIDPRHRVETFAHSLDAVSLHSPAERRPGRARRDERLCGGHATPSLDEFDDLLRLAAVRPRGQR